MLLLSVLQTVVLLPLPVVLRLRLPRQQKIGTAVLLSLGLLVSVADVVRTYVEYGVFETVDLTWHSFPLLMVCMIEVWLMVRDPLVLAPRRQSSVGDSRLITFRKQIVCACLPPIRPLLMKVGVLARNTTFSSTRKNIGGTTASVHHMKECHGDGSICQCYALYEVTSASQNPKEFPTITIDAV